ncbi:Ankyrin repeat family protein [Abeliophyllum distichum]|uniref:Ankyrin repeat family protein n=1 Tax=Abeliophyllum distichum TaxID=126358 RepID=A0ABD1V618_9LAMI
MASSSSKLGSNITDNSITEKDLNFYLPLYKAAIQGDWESASIFFDSNPDAITARITKILETVLHIAVGRSEAIHFVEKLVELMPVEALPLTSKFSETAVHYAAKYGNINAAKLLIARDPGLPHIWSDTNLLPLHLAALFGHKEMVSFLLTVTKDNIEPNPFADKPGITLLISIVYSGFYDVALDLVQRYPKLAVTISPGGNTALSILAGKPSAFLSGCSLGFWQKFIYSCVPVKLAKISHRQSRNDIENLSVPTPKHIDICCRFLIQIFRKDYLLFACQKLHKKFWEVIQAIVPQITLHLAQYINQQSLPQLPLGHYEVLEEILKAFPSAIWSLDKEKHDLFQMAVINRRETIFNLLYELDEHAHLVTKNTDIHDNNILHLAGKMAPPHRLNLLAGAALQMQRELQWYKEVQNFVTPSYKGKENSDGKTPAIVFTEEHKDLITKGEQWLKETAKSCTFAGTLIATVVFAAAITVPGGSSSKSGIPIFHKEEAFSSLCHFKCSFFIFICYFCVDVLVRSHFPLC